MAPEIWEGKPYDYKSDIWSAGCLIYELTNLRPPFESTSQLNLGLKIKEGKYNKLPTRYSMQLNEVIMSMLQVNVDQRINTHEILQNKIMVLRSQD